MNRSTTLGALFAVTALALVGCSAGTTTAAPEDTSSPSAVEVTPTITPTPEPLQTSLVTEEEAANLSNFYLNEVPTNTYGTGDAAFEQHLRNDYPFLIAAMPEVPDYAWIEVGKGACSSLDYAGIAPFAMGWNQLEEEGYDEAYIKEQQAKDMALILVSVPTLCPENQSVVDAVFQLAETMD
jgi:hypothetical protein